MQFAESLVGSSLLLGVDGVSVCLGPPSLLLQADLLFCGLQALGFGALLGGLGGRLLRGAFALGLRLGLLLVGLHPALGLRAIALGATFAFLLGDLVLQTLAFELRFGLLALEIGLSLSLLSFLSLASRL